MSFKKVHDTRSYIDPIWILVSVVEVNRLNLRSKVIPRVRGSDVEVQTLYDLFS